jgi:hypothetical protein
MEKATKANSISAPKTPAELLGFPEPLGILDIPNGIFLPDIDASNVYALRLVGDCLSPVARDGEHAIISPTQPVNPGDFVALNFAGDRGPMVKLLLVPSALPLGTSAAGSGLPGLLMVEMLNPRRIIRLRSSDLAAMHRVVGFLKHDGTMTDTTTGVVQ